ncbi:MAG: tetratricopeptide repeat protein [Candidatus Korobacteraceae bacterium]
MGQPEHSAQSPSHTAPAGRPANRAVLIALALVIITVAIYSQVSRYDFADVDDAAYLTDNVHIKYGLDWEGVKWAFTTFYVANWHPITWLSHALDCELFRLNPGRHHNVNVLLHGLDAVLVFWVLLRATGYLGRSAMVAGLFALHPINVESVVWIAERKNLLSMLFFLLALAAYRWYAVRPRMDRYLVVALLFAAGLMSKPQVITLPFVLLLWDYWPLQRMFSGSGEDSPGLTPAATEIPPRKLSWLIAEKLPLLALSATSAVITMKAQQAGGAINPLNSYGLPVRLENAVVSYVLYIGKAIWPAHLAAFYPYPAGSLTRLQILASALFLLLVTALVLFNRRRRYLLVGWFWFLGTLVPMIGAVQVGDQGMADRYAYLPFVGLFIMICWGLADLLPKPVVQAESLGSGAVERRSVSRIGLAIASMAVLVALAAVTHRQIGYWRDDVTLWSHAAQVTTGNYQAETYLGQALLRRENPDAAVPHFQTAIAMYPAGPTAYLFLGYAEQQRGNLREAIAQYQKALDVTQSYGQAAARVRLPALENMGHAYRALGDYTRGNQCLQAAQDLIGP